jgi:hypothetical protein
LAEGMAEMRFEMRTSFRELGGKVDVLTQRMTQLLDTLEARSARRAR